MMRRSDSTIPLIVAVLVSVSLTVAVLLAQYLWPRQIEALIGPGARGLASQYPPGTRGRK